MWMYRNGRAGQGSLLALTALLAASVAGLGTPASGAPPTGIDGILAAAPAADWRRVDPENTLYLTLPSGRVVIELAPEFAPAHVANIKRLTRAGFFDNLRVVRAQDNYVVQWGDADSKKPTGEGVLRLKAEFDKAIDPTRAFVPLPDRDTYAPTVGFAGDFPAARNPARSRTWLVHCYGMVGAGRDSDADSGGGPELYAVIGQAPRQLDRNVTLVGRVIDGMEVLSTLPRGHGNLGFYQELSQTTPILSVRVAADIPLASREDFQMLRTDSKTFAKLINNRRFRRGDWYKFTAGRLDVCNVPLPVRSVRR